jgi:hypothetical protein
LDLLRIAPWGWAVRAVVQAGQPLLCEAPTPAFDGMAAQAERAGNGRRFLTGGGSAHDLGPVYQLLWAGSGVDYAVQAAAFFIS